MTHPGKLEIGRPSGTTTCAASRTALRGESRTRRFASANAAVHQADVVARIADAVAACRAGEPATRRRTRPATGVDRGARARSPRRRRRRGRTIPPAAGSAGLAVLRDGQMLARSSADSAARAGGEAATRSRARSREARRCRRSRRRRPRSGVRARAAAGAAAVAAAAAARRRRRACGLIISARTSAAACISSAQSAPASRRSPARVARPGREREQPAAARAAPDRHVRRQRLGRRRHLPGDATDLRSSARRSRGTRRARSTRSRSADRRASAREAPWA